LIDNSRRAMSTRRLVTIETFTTDLEASLAKGALEAGGIRAVVSTERLGTFSRGATPAAVLQVFAADRDRGLVALRRLKLHVVAEREREVRRTARRRPEWLSTAKVLVAFVLAFLVLALIAAARNRAGQQPLGTPRTHAGR